MVALNFNSQMHSPEYGTIPQLPPGKGYRGMIVKTEGVANKNGQGSHLALTLQVVDGPLTGKQQIDRLNLFNSSEKTVEIANKQLSAYCHVTGVFMIQDTDQLCGKPFTFDVEEQADNPQYTHVVAIYDAQGNKPGQSGSTQQSAPQAPPPQAAPPAPAADPVWSPPAASGSTQQSPPAANPAPPGGWGAPQPSAAPAGWGNK